jgi:hypothetical protein
LPGASHLRIIGADPKAVLDKLNPVAVHTQICIIAKMMTLMDRVRPAQLKGREPITDGTCSEAEGARRQRPRRLKAAVEPPRLFPIYLPGGLRSRTWR